MPALCRRTRLALVLSPIRAPGSAGPAGLDGGAWEPVPLTYYHLRAADLNQYVARRRGGGWDRGRVGEVGDRPGDHFNARGRGPTSSPVGWRVFRTSPSMLDPPGRRRVSASTGFCHGPPTTTSLYVFSASSLFEVETLMRSRHALVRRLPGRDTGTRPCRLRRSLARRPIPGRRHAREYPKRPCRDPARRHGRPGTAGTPARGVWGNRTHRDVINLNSDASRKRFVTSVLKALPGLNGSTAPSIRTSFGC